MKNKILLSIAVVIVVAVAAWGVSLSLNRSNMLDVASVNLEAIAATENTEEESTDIKELYKKNHQNEEKACTVLDSYECKIGITIPKGIPYIGGTECYITYIKEVESPGTQNHCRYTGNKDNVCDYYTCKKKRKITHKITPV